MLAASVLCLPAAHAGSVPPAETNLRSSADEMISFRHQKHSWVTDDGQFQLLYNRGYQTTGDALALASSVDGITWTSPKIKLPGTDDKSTADGSLNAGLLSVVYATAKGGINFAPIKYDLASKSWKVKGPGQVVRNGTDDKTNFGGKPALIPTLVEDQNGDFWCVFLEYAYTDKQNKLGTAALKLYHRTKDGNTWSDTGVTFGNTSLIRDLTQPKLSGRLVRTPDSIGVIFGDGADIYWAERFPGGLPTGNWLASSLLVAGTPDSEADKDPYATHYSVTIDDQKNIHLVYADAKIPYYRRFNALAQGGPSWGTKTVAFSKDPLNTGYTEVSYLGGGNIAVVFNAQATNPDGTNKLSNLRVWQSPSRGQDGWVCTHVLTHAKADPNSQNEFAHMRNEMPSLVPAATAAGGVPVLLQHQPYEDGAKIYAALSYRFSQTQLAGCQQPQ